MYFGRRSLKIDGQSCNQGVMHISAAAQPNAHDGSLPSALHWVEGVLVGSVGSTIAIIAVGLTGFALLSGRMPFRHGASVVLGCFILFGAPAIAKGLLDLGFVSSGPVSISPPSVILPPPLPSKAPQPNYDPYAGASVPM